jgi:hypothetical protein
MRILGEGGADAPSSGQNGCRGMGRRSSRFRPVRHFPSHSLQSTAAKSACTALPGPSQGLPYLSRTRSSQENAGVAPRVQRRRAGESVGISPTDSMIRRTGAPRGRTTGPVTAPPAGVSDAGPLTTARTAPAAGPHVQVHPGIPRNAVRPFTSAPAIFGQLGVVGVRLTYRRTNTCATCGSTMRRYDSGRRCPGSGRHEAYFPVGRPGETLRDRMLYATLSCRLSVRW